MTVSTFALALLIAVIKAAVSHGTVTAWAGTTAVVAATPVRARVTRELSPRGRVLRRLIVVPFVKPFVEPSGVRYADRRDAVRLCRALPSTAPRTPGPGEGVTVRGAVHAP